MNISIEPKLVNPRVKDHRGYNDMIFDLEIFLDLVDLDTGSTIGYQIFKTFDIEFEYTEENPFVPFENITEEQVNSLVNRLIEEERVGGQDTLMEWVEKRFNQIYAEPKQKPFLFQLNQ